MAEAEDVITDAARHATVFARALWQRHRPPRSRATVVLDDVAARLDLLAITVFGHSYPIRKAQTPAPPTLLARVSRRAPSPRRRQAIPATDGTSVWLPPEMDLVDRPLATDCYRSMALQQIARARRGSADVIPLRLTPLVRDVYLLVESHSADAVLAKELPGLKPSLAALRRHALAARPPLSSFSPPRRALEQLVRRLLQSDCEHPTDDVPVSPCPAESLSVARTIAAGLAPDDAAERAMGAHPLVEDWWTGELLAPCPLGAVSTANDAHGRDEEPTAAARSARLQRRPRIRDAKDGEDEDQNNPGPWVPHPEHPHTIAEDPMGLQRPADRDDETSAEDLADMVSELSEARLISTPGRPREILQSDDPPPARSLYRQHAQPHEEFRIRYPEWDYRIGAYRDPGATVRVRSPEQGSQDWVDATLIEYRSMLAMIRRRFELLRAEPRILRRRLDGEEVDLGAYLESYADFCAGLSRSEALYQTRRPARRSLAISLLVDVSGSTDSWISDHRRVIDIEREALLLVCLALNELGEPYSVQAFSGDGPQAVDVWDLKTFDEPHSNETARRIAALAPERYTRAGAALRHASTCLLQQPASHRLLLLLSDGKPNDMDEYGGRYGVEDMRQAVSEARLQGAFPFCLTIDSQAANYLPRIFGAHHYALLPRPELLPAVLLDWVKRLLAA